MEDDKADKADSADNSNSLLYFPPFRSVRLVVCHAFAERQAFIDCTTLPPELLPDELVTVGAGVGVGPCERVRH